MIIDLLLGLLDGLVMAFLSLLPDSGPGSDATSGLAGVLGNLTAMNYFLPVAEVTTAVVGALLVFPAFMGVSLTVWLVALIRGGSARG